MNAPARLRVAAPGDVVVVLATAAGLAVVLAHDVWSGGVLPIVITLMGWAAVLKGIALLLIPGDRRS